MFQIINEINKQYIFKDNSKTTKHLHDRLYRFKKSNYTINDIYKCFIVDKNHNNGLEVHAITYDASVLIFNYRSKKLITVLNARPQQLKRYCWMPKMLLEKAYKNVKYQLNK